MGKVILPVTSVTLPVCPSEGYLFLQGFLRAFVLQSRHQQANPRVSGSPVRVQALRFLMLFALAGAVTAQVQVQQAQFSKPSFSPWIPRSSPPG